MPGGELAIVIAGRREDWPGGPQTLAPREPTREPNGQTLWVGAELDPDGDHHDQVWFRIAEEAIGRMPEKDARPTRRRHRGIVLHGRCPPRRRDSPTEGGGSVGELPDGRRGVGSSGFPAPGVAPARVAQQGLVR